MEVLLVSARLLPVLATLAEWSRELREDGVQADWALAPGSQSVARGDSARGPCYLVTVLSDIGRWTMILCRSWNGSCAVS